LGFILSKHKKILSIIGIVAPFISVGIIIISEIMRDFVNYDVDFPIILAIIAFPFFCIIGFILSAIAITGIEDKKYKIICYLGMFSNAILAILYFVVIKLFDINIS